MDRRELAKLQERIRQSRAGLVRELAPAPASPASAEARLGVTRRPGDRVVDLVTGEEGVILGGTVENVIVPIAGR